MNISKNREKIIREFLGLEELSPMELGVIRGGEGKYGKTEKDPKKPAEDIEIDP